jgi:hypothetical protein
MHKPYRDIVKQGEVTFKKPEPRERKRSSLPTIPRSTVINFIAIALLFGVIFAMQHVSRNWIGGDAEETQTEVTAKAKPVTVTLDETTAAVEKDTADNVKVTTEETVATETAPPPTTPVKTAIVTLEENDEVEQETTPKPATTKEKVKTTKPRRRAYRITRPARYGRDPYWQDRQTSVEELDNELARQRYKNLNREYSSETVEETTVEPTYSSSYDYKARERYQPTVYEPTYERSYTTTGDLDGEAAREKYRSENKRLSGPDADLDY